MDIRSVIRRLLAGQTLGVLATRESGSPYQSLVAFVSGFVKSPSCRLFRIAVRVYIVVTEFQQVRRYNPVQGAGNVRKSRPAAPAARS
jgi:hypothetical protein